MDKLFIQIEERLCQLFGNRKMPFSEFVFLEQQYHAKKDFQKKFIITIYLASLFARKDALTAAKEWLIKAKKLAPEVSQDPSCESDIALFLELEKKILDETASFNKPTDNDKSLLAQLMAGLTRKPMTRIELIELLFDKVDFENAENRLKNLLHRARKQFPNQIIKTGGVYSLSVEVRG
ncbi:MAG: hypothetical protein ACXVCY_17980 [Pseudobdellovibrionaceae bacterium]